MNLPYLARLACVLALLLATPLFALAAEEGGQKDVLAPDLVNSVVTLIVFLCLLGVLYKTAWGPILVGLKNREDAQQKIVDDAKKSLSDAADLKVQLQAEMAKAAETVRGMIEEARRDAEALRASERAIGLKEAAEERARAKRDIENAKDVALDEIYKQAVDLATTLSAKTLSRQISADDHRKLLADSITELKQSTT